jgi:hypothetical protein
MATRSAIGVMHGDVCKAVYCHWDGYLEYNGKILKEHYKDFAKVNKLISLGDISSLGPEVGDEHPFSSLDSELSSEEYDVKYGNMTTFYGRDRGETTSFETFMDFEKLATHYSNTGCEYIYIFKDGEWFVSKGAYGFETLERFEV